MGISMNPDLDYEQRNVIATECVQRHAAASVIRLYRLVDYPIIKLANPERGLREDPRSQRSAKE
jgi:hypothetical protein